MSHNTNDMAFMDICLQVPLLIDSPIGISRGKLTVEALVPIRLDSRD